MRNDTILVPSPYQLVPTVAASDFDGTLFRNRTISEEDLAAIKSWRAAGNLFGIVTGRAFAMLVPHLKEFALDVDFSACCNGAIIYDSAGRVIFESELPKKILIEILAEPLAARSMHFAFETANEIFCARVKESSWILREKGNWNFSVTFVDVAQLETLPPINQLALDFPSPEDAKVAAAMLNEKFGDVIFAQKNTHSVDIVPAGINKAQGVATLLELRNCRGASVCVIGDESNDLPMIRHFGGYTVATAKDFVKREAAEVFDSVGAMLNHFLR